MTDKEKLEKIKKLADAMYYAAANLGPNVGSGERLRKTMEDYHKFIIHEYNKEEPKFKVGDYIKPVDSCLGSPRTIVEVCDSWYVTNQGTIDFEYEDNWELVEEYNITGIKSRHATGKLKECIDNQTKEGLDKARKQLEENPQECMYTKDNYTDNDRKTLCDGCKEKCEYAQKEADWLQELHCKLDSLSKEDFEKVWAKYHQKEEPVREDFEKEIEKMWAQELKYRDTDYTIAELTKQDYEDCARHFAYWQKQQMMANAVDVTVHIDNGNYPYIPQMELYDYDKDIPLAREGDKYKVILIKE